VSNKAGGYPFNLIAKLFLSFFGGTGVWTQSFMGTLSFEPCLEPFALVILKILSCFWPSPTWTTILLLYASCFCWDDRLVSFELFSFEMG
jgi:hypothetical protein